MTRFIVRRQGIDLALIPPPGAFIYSVIGDIQDIPGMGLVDTHVIMTKKEYDQIYSEKAKAEREVSSTKYEAERAINDARRGAQYTAQQAAAEAQKKHTIPDLRSCYHTLCRNTH